MYGSIFIPSEMRPPIRSDTTSLFIIYYRVIDLYGFQIKSEPVLTDVRTVERSHRGKFVT